MQQHPEGLGLAGGRPTGVEDRGLMCAMSMMAPTHDERAVSLLMWRGLSAQHIRKTHVTDLPLERNTDCRQGCAVS